MNEPIQIVEMLLPKCGNTFGSAPCTATGSGNDKCFNTFSTCKDIPNYRSIPEGGLADPDLIKREGETIASGDVTRTADLFAAFDVRFPVVPSGIIWEQGGSADQAAYLGITGSDLVFRVGDGTVSSPTNGVKLTTPYSNVAGKTVTLFVEIDVSANSASLWWFCPCELVLTLLATGTASGSFSTWAGTDGGAIGLQGGSNIATGEDGGTFNGDITEARFYDSTAAPDMTTAFRSVLYFGHKRTNNKPADDITVYPFITNISTVGSKINLAGQEADYDPLGNRAFMQITMDDGVSSDIGIDPYLSEREYDPLSLSTFWIKFAVRQKFGKVNALIRLYEGYSGDKLSDMRSRTYILDHINFPGGSNVSLHCRDILTKAELNKSEAPIASPGYLLTDILSTDLTFSLKGAIETDYDASGTVRINDETIIYDSFTDIGDGVLQFTVNASGRGSDGTTASDHSAEDAVQLCLRYTDQGLYAILTDLFGSYTSIEYQFLNLSLWESEIDEHLPEYILSTLITEPTPVKTLLGELTTQCAFYLWWNERDAKVDLKAIRGQSTQPPRLNDNEHFIADSVSLKEMPDQRVSRVRFKYLQRDPTEPLDEIRNYKSIHIEANLQAESSFAFRQKQIKNINSRWITAGAQALQTSSRYINRFEEIPIEITFQLDSKDRSYWVGDTFYLEHWRIVDKSGKSDTGRYFLITSAEEDITNGRIIYTAFDATLAGFIYVIMDDATPDYKGDGTDQFNGTWISDENGFYSNGDRGARMS